MLSEVAELANSITSLQLFIESRVWLKTRFRKQSTFPKSLTRRSFAANGVFTAGSSTQCRSLLVAKLTEHFFFLWNLFCWNNIAQFERALVVTKFSWTFFRCTHFFSGFSTYRKAVRAYTCCDVTLGFFRRPSAEECSLIKGQRGLELLTFL